MRFVLSAEQTGLRDSVVRFLDRRMPTAEVRKLTESETGHDAAAWSEMADLGWQGVLIPEEYGGSGLTFVELAILLEEMGRRLACPSFLTTVALGAVALASTRDEDARRRWLPQVAAGRLTMTLALADDAGRWLPTGTPLHAERRGSGYALDGCCAFVPDGHLADVVIAMARTPDGWEMFAVDAHDETVRRTPLPTLDLTRRHARLEFAGTPARLLDTGGDAVDVVARVLDLAAVALAAEQVGGAQRCLEMSTDYAKHRFQFGRAIGSFQAIKHKCVDVLVQVESATSAAQYAAWCAADASAELATVAPLVQAYCAEAYARAAAENVQIHGGVGFTWEHDAHLYLRRAKASAALLGTPEWHREQLVSRLGV